MKFIKYNFMWVIYVGFAAVALTTHTGEPLFSIAGPYGVGKMLVWALLAIFLAYSLYCSTRENFFKTVKTLWPYYWARQVSYDLYIGVLITLTLIYFNEGFIVLMFWLVPVLLMANLATLLYLAMNYQSLVAHFIG